MNDLGGESTSPASPPSSEEKTMAMVAHGLGIVTCFLGPLVIYLIKKDESDFIRRAALQALYWQIFIVVAAIVLAVVTFCLGGIGAFLCQVASIVYGIVAIVRTNEGRIYSYPVSGKFVK